MTWTDSAHRHLKAGNLAEAIRLCTMRLAIVPGDLPALHVRTIARLIGDDVGAVTDLRRLAAAKGGFPELRIELATTAADCGYFDEAIALARKGGTEAKHLLSQLTEAPYFGTNHALQGGPARQVYMSAVVGLQWSSDRPLRILEIGSYMGASLLTWAGAVTRLAGGRAEIHCVDPWEDAATDQYADAMGQALRSGKAYRFFANARRFIPKSIKVVEWRGFSQEVLPRLGGERFDIIYVDGCHLHPEVLNDLRACDALLEDGGIICGDDLEAQIDEIAPMLAHRHARGDFIRDAVTGRGFHPGVTLGVAEFFGCRVSVYRGFWVMRKRGPGYQPVAMEGRGVLPDHWPEALRRQAAADIAEDGLVELV